MASSSNNFSDSLLVKKFPQWLKATEKESLLRYFGAVEVTVMADKGKMRNCAFAKFANHEEAKIAMTKLHQLEVFGSRLVTVYATEKESKEGSAHDNMGCDALKKEKEKNNSKQQLADEHPTADRGRCYMSPPPGLSYSYPPPTQLIISNIANAISCIPQLYVQVLHLMNKMNLPPPFGPPAPTSVPLLPPPTPLIDNLSAHLSSEESEIESDKEEKKRKKLVKLRKARIGLKRSLKDRDIKNDSSPQKSFKVDELFPDYTIHRKLEINAPSELHTELYSAPTDNVYQIPEASNIVTKPLLSPQVNTSEQENANTGKVEETSQFVSLAELRSNRITNEEMQEMSIYKNYTPGQQSMRLYIKNLSKQITDKELRFIYGRYIDWTNDTHINSFDVRVMQQGRMKGQAFVGLPSEELALSALQDTNGYLLQGKPMVVTFARSTKAKETDKILLDNLSKNHKQS